MATKASFAKIESDNYSRMEQGLAVAATALQDILEVYVPHHRLLAFLRKSFGKEKLLSKEQIEIVNRTAEEGYKEFDIPLTYKLLRNICTRLIDPQRPGLPPPTRGWEKEPFPNNVTLSDDIERLRLLRNRMHGYSAQAAIPETEYREKWDQLKEICGRLQTHTNRDYVTALTKLENYVLVDIQLKELIEELQVLGITPDREIDSKVSAEKITKLFDLLREINQEETENVLVEPLLKSSVPSIVEIYAPVSIRKDLENQTRKPRVHGKEKKTKAELVNKPEDIFLKNGRPTRFVMMQGGAGRGKSVYCLQLMKYWCNAKNSGASNKRLSEWEERLDKYDLLYLIKLRHVFTNVTSLVDMICNDIEYRGYSGMRETMCYVLTNDKYSSLILVDGLDEWKAQDQASSKSTQWCVPDTRGITNATLFFTMRPWKFDSVAHLIQKNDRVLEIQGLEADGIEVVAEKLLIKYFGIKKNSPVYKRELSEIKEKSRNKMLKTILQIPLIAIVSVILWYNKEDVGYCMTTFYIALIRMLIERAIENKFVDHKIVEKMTKSIGCKEALPGIIFHENMLNRFSHLLCNLGEIAYKDLISSETRLVFEKLEMEKRIGMSELEFALNVGLLTQSDAPGPAHAKHVSFHFFHKSVQEFLTAVYISSNEEASKSFVEKISSVDAVLWYGNIIMFLSGMSPSLGYILSQRVVRATYFDKRICTYRKTLQYELKRKVELLYHSQLRCLRELKHTGQQTPHDSLQSGFHVSDVYVDDDSDIDTLRMTADVLCYHNTDIVSLYIDKVASDGGHGITDEVINNYLQCTSKLSSLLVDGYNNRTLHVINTVTSLKVLVLYCLSITPSLLHDIQTSLHNNTHIHRLGLVYIKCVDSGELRCDNKRMLTTSFCSLLKNLSSCENLSELCISYMLNKTERDMLVRVLPQLPHLKDIEYTGSTYYDVGDVEYDYTIVHMLTQCTQLRELGLAHISLDDRSLELTADMGHIEVILLIGVDMSVRGWGKFISSLLNVPHQFEVKLWNTNISADVVEKILSYFNLSITLLDLEKSLLEFTRMF